MVHKISCIRFHASDFILIFSKGLKTRKEDNSDKKKNNMSAIFPWGIHIWNFKTLACTVFAKRMDARIDGCTHKQPETNIRSWGHKNCWNYSTPTNWTMWKLVVITVDLISKHCETQKISMSQSVSVIVNGNKIYPHYLFFGLFTALFENYYVELLTSLNFLWC